MSRTILAVDDDPVQRRLAEAALVKFGYTVLQADSGEAALAAFEGPDGGGIAAVLLDLLMPGLDGLEVLSELRRRGIHVPVVVQTAQGGLDTAIAAMRAGAFDFVVKPAAPEKLRATLESALKVEAVEGAARRRRKPSPDAVTFADIITRSATMERVMDLARKAAASTIPVMIEGESGVGKELVARAIRGSGDRAGKPFVTVNCGAIPENLVESILFGHEKGAFTGATERHTGKFTEANTGTLFLDEIGDLPLDAQVKLLRAVQEGEVEPVGARTSQSVDIRIISATHHDLMEAVRQGSFREDLYYRLNVFPIRVPPLRERREDIAWLVGHFIKRFAASQPQSRVRDISEAAVALLSAYDWPGNIRQLENAVFRAMVLCEGSELSPQEFPQIRAQVEGIDLSQMEIAPMPVPARAGHEETVAPTAPDLPGEDFGAAPRPLEDHVRRPDSAAELLSILDADGDIRSLAEVENEMIRLAVQRYDGQMSEVARRLGIGRSTLYRKLKELGLDPEAMRAGRTLA